MLYEVITHKDLIKEKQEQTHKLVETAFSILQEQSNLQMSGAISLETAQQQAKAAISGLRYDETNYFWINDLDARIVLHPVKPELNDKDMSAFTDPNGKRIFAEFAAVAKRDGEGVVDYQFAKPGSPEPVSYNFV